MFRNNEEIVLNGINPVTFSRLLEYIYTGVIAINDDNVFEIYECCNYLQLRSSDPLADKCVKWMINKLNQNCNLNPDLLVKMWSFSESFGSVPLGEAVLSYLDLHLESLIERNILAFLGFNEICHIITRPSLCVQQSMFVCTSIINWLLRKCVPESDEDTEMAQAVLQKLKAKFPFFPGRFLQKVTASLMPLTNFDDTDTIGTTCTNCHFLSLWSRDESEICGISQYLEERKQEQAFVSITLNKDQCPPVEQRTLKASRSYFQHYGPVNVSDGLLLASDCGTFLFYLAGKKAQSRSKFLVDRLFNEEIYVFEFSSMTWLRMTNVLPRRLLHFKAVCMRKRLYIIGGYTDIKSKSDQKTVKVDGLNLSISRAVYCIHMDDWFSSSGKWKEITAIPESLTGHDFSVVLNYDNQKLVLVASDRLDIFDTLTNDWTTIHRGRPKKIPQESKKQVAAILGSVVYVISRDETANPMWVIDLSEDDPVWQPLLPLLGMRFWPLSAFSHGHYLYLMGHQTATSNFLYRYDAIKKDWHKLWEHFKGHLSPTGGVLLRQNQRTSSSSSSVGLLSR